VTRADAAQFCRFLSIIVLENKPRNIKNKNLSKLLIDATIVEFCAKFYIK